MYRTVPSRANNLPGLGALSPGSQIIFYASVVVHKSDNLTLGCRPADLRILPPSITRFQRVLLYPGTDKGQQPQLTRQLLPQVR
jgi:hypothetical protein